MSVREPQHRAADAASGARPGGRDQGMVILSYLLAGIGLYGGLGWLADHFWHISWGLPVGIIVGLAASLYIIIKRFGSGE
ncbi:hypothetical protein GCM10009785_06470 [Brooklawnia cerclae]|uniref:F0F1-type ATP synthase assembly protein I n=1 Tax=Brooklawnia cerclae TaxID=349934 RepID=A0ABX0SGV4_9ACTN|nr:hypothetical protein [Brooklawnia cerclae]NIH56430.1 F0F1-type ATP synthase assembly protein I [Brooklawnia cerclae]